MDGMLSVTLEIFLISTIDVKSINKHLTPQSVMPQTVYSKNNVEAVKAPPQTLWESILQL